MGNCCIVDQDQKLDMVKSDKKSFKNDPSYQSHISTNSSKDKSFKRLEFTESFQMQPNQSKTIQTFYEYPHYKDTKKLLNLILTQTHQDYWYEYQDQLEDIQEQIQSEKLLLEQNYQNKINILTFEHQKRLFIEIQELKMLTQNQKIKNLYNPFIEFKIRKNEPYAENQYIIQENIKSNIVENNVIQIQNGLNFNYFNKYDLIKQFTNFTDEQLENCRQQQNSSHKKQQFNMKKELSNILEQEQETENEMTASTQTQVKYESEQKQNIDQQVKDTQKSNSKIIKEFSEQSNQNNKEQLTYRQYFLDFIVKAHSSKTNKQSKVKVIADPVTFNLSEFINQQVIEKAILLKNPQEETVAQLKIKVQFLNNITEFYKYWNTELSARQEQIKRILEYVDQDFKNNTIDEEEIQIRRNKMKKDRRQSMIQEDVQSLINKSLFQRNSIIRSNGNTMRSQQLSHSDSFQSSYYETGFVLE